MYTVLPARVYWVPFNDLNPQWLIDYGWGMRHGNALECQSKHDSGELVHQFAVNIACIDLNQKRSLASLTPSGIVLYWWLSLWVTSAFSMILQNGMWHPGRGHITSTFWHSAILCLSYGTSLAPSGIVLYWCLSLWHITSIFWHSVILIFVFMAHH